MSDTIDITTIEQRFEFTKAAIKKGMTHNKCTFMRLYRSISWLRKAFEIIKLNDCHGSEQGNGEKVDHDLATICLWLAFNALYGQWTLFDVEDESDSGDDTDSSSGNAMPEHKAIDEFLETIFQQDKKSRLTAFIDRKQSEIRKLFSSRYMSVEFWRARYKDPSHDKADRAANVYDKLLEEGNHLAILSKLLLRIYLMRCQLIHGASTYGSSVNRQNVKTCQSLLTEFVPIVFYIMMEDHIDHDYGKLCYPPLT